MRDEAKPLAKLPHPSSGRPHPSLWHVFCAIELPPQARKSANEHIRKLSDSFPQVRASWTRDEKFHLTVKFLGEINKERVESLALAAARATASLGPFELSIEGAGAFPGSGRPKVLWLGVFDAVGGLTELQARLEAECEQEGFAKEGRAFQPHLTIARLREPKGARALASSHQEAGFPRVEITVSELLVIRSELSSAGAKYTVISRHLLTGSAGVPPA